MKGKFMWASLLLCAGLWACTDDAIDGQSGGQGASGEGTPAYLTISFSANSGSSTRATNNGDEHGGADDSKHHSTGTKDESKITSALVVVAPQEEGTGAAGFAKVYSFKEAASAGDEDFTLVDDNNQLYGLKNPIKILTGDYNVLVVINPADALLGTDDSNLTTGIDGTTSAENAEKISALYDKITEEAYKYTAASGETDNYTNAANSIGMGLETPAEPYFMMANQKPSPVQVTIENTPENPAEAEVSVERVLSKITFRDKKAADGVAVNAYPVEVDLGSAPAITTYAAVPKAGDEPTEYEVVILNKAFDALDKDIYALYDEDGKLTKVYKLTATEYTGDDKDNYEQEKIYQAKEVTAILKDDASYSENKNYAVEDINNNNTLDDDEKLNIRLDFDEDAAPESETWYVQLQGYALVNLAKEVNYVRHTIGTGSAIQEPFGTLGTNTYLWTPYWEEKNALDVTTDFSSSIQTGWFYNKLADVSNESKTLSVSNGSISYETDGYFRALPTTGDDNSTVTGDDHYTGAGETALPAVGKLLTYCFENSTDANHQQHGLSTGISFVAQIFKNKDCTQPIEKLYLYADRNYTSLDQIGKAYGDATPDAIKNLINGTTTENKENLEAAGITLYESNVCYYYTTEIKHFDNGNDNELGVNEFIIMRNNIYSLSVTGIDKIGSPFVDPTPNVPNETTEAALSLKVNILPWIVRYNDIEF